MSKRDYYDLLGVGKTASPDEIKKAFRKAAIEHHPDKGGDEIKFKEINEAYEILSNPDKRKRYDQFGHAGVGGASSSSGGFGGFGNGQEMHFDFGDLGLGDIFSSFFGGSSNQARQRQTRGRDIEATVELVFEQAIFGAEVDISLNINSECSSCKGTTVEKGYSLKTCSSCNGSGQVATFTQTIFGRIQQVTVCSNCSGQGKIPEKKCESCKGAGVKKTDQKVSLKIPAGIDDGATIRLRDQGEAIANGPRGDLYVNVRVKSHKHFTREGELILSEERIDMVDAALGTEIEVNTVDGPVKMKIPAGTQSGTDFKLSGHGVPSLKGQQRGAHIVTIIVDTPTKLTKRQQELLREFKSNKKRGFFA